MTSLDIKVGSYHTFNQLIEILIDFGYEHVGEMVRSGQFRYLGGTLWITPVNVMSPIKIDFFGNEIESIVEYDKDTKLKSSSLSSIEISNNYILTEDGIIRPDDYLVHEDHGIGMFSHIETIVVEGENITYFVVNYLNNDVLRVPMSQRDKLSTYIGVGKRRPKLNKLGTSTWTRTYHKTYANVMNLARELLEVFAKRKIVLKKPLVINSEWDNKISDTFGFVETEDQVEAIQSVFDDLQKTAPMDRLICGDVGFGKTEVAIRAITQTVANGYQAIFLVPTTILAEQHFLTLKRRFENLPVEIGHLSRFVGKEDEHKTIQGLKDGKVDILVSTHKVLRSQLEFKNPGLLVIDEEQKFGVGDKEKIKKLRNEIDVLTLTATPIPRTLFMSLSGLRDISRLSSVPAGRKRIETKVHLHDEEKVFEYINREISRGGQVYYLHNRVATIIGAKNKLQKMFPNLHLALAHGQMEEGKLLEVMADFTAGKIDVLICSTIIENGLDLPNVNTLIVEESDRFGLSQLYQIRGRIGRSKRQSYALFTYKQKNLLPNAIKRLKAIVENTELGAGYSISLHDLEIRGGGNILGRDQHGNMEALGLVLYSKLLKQAVAKFKKTDLS